ncbi:MAG: internalization-related competence protein ComEC/Rec2 protein [Candidatus Moranbacteria bacterium GW2011_GWA2_39_41]|nr:MAG: internalization-related competence protein ComEC/Rec2 protein [Candidatus Moranbacteria bacterium GW2011_GWA2_39_41]
MQYRKTIYAALLLLLIIGLILSGIIWYEKRQDLKVIFLDVGQGDAILIEQGSNQILIDGGSSGQVLMEKLGRYVPFWDHEIEMVIATHPDQDHIEGLLDVLKNYKVDSLVETTAQSDSQLYKKYENLIEQKKIQKITAASGMKIKFDQAEMEVLSPVGEVPTGVVKDTNMYSVVTKLVFGQNAFLFTGDLPDTEERSLIQNQVDVSAKILKVAHHGSKYSSTDVFLEKVQPRSAIISVSKNNRFGHPAPEALGRLLAHKINIFRTDELGDIAYECQNPNVQCQMMLN